MRLALCSQNQVWETALPSPCLGTRGVVRLHQDLSLGQSSLLFGR